MPKNFTVVEIEDVPVVQLSTKQVDALELLFDIKPMSGLVYNGKRGMRKVLKVSSVKGCVPNDTAYMHTVAHQDGNNIPMVNYVDIKTGVHGRDTIGDFVEWLGGEFSSEVPEPSPPSAEDQALGRLAAATMPEREDFAKADKVTPKEKKEGKWKPAIKKKAKTK